MGHNTYPSTRWPRCVDPLGLCEGKHVLFLWHALRVDFLGRHGQPTAKRDLGINGWYQLTELTECPHRRYLVQWFLHKMCNRMYRCIERSGRNRSGCI